jgi:DNA-binding GntR family transcriptional regulator
MERDNLQGTVKKDVEFHDIIYRSSRNDKLIQIVSNLSEQVHRFRIIYLKDYSSPRNVAKEHTEIIEAISGKDPEVAQKIAAKHIKNQEVAIIKSIEKHDLY